MGEQTVQTSFDSLCTNSFKRVRVHTPPLC